MSQFDFQAFFQARTPTAQQALERFWTTYQRYVAINNAVALTILVWGPGVSSNSRLATKRKDVRAALLQQGHNALFSEELVANDSARPQSIPEPLTVQAPTNLKLLEFAQATAADLIIILLGDDAMGALAEAVDFGNHPDLAGKLYVLAPLAYQTSYAGRGSLWLLEKGYGGVYWYAESEVESCTVLHEALIRVQARREIYAYAASQIRGRS